jgi:internalin A
MSELALQRIREAKEQRLTRLDIGNCGLTEIPEEVFELTWLKKLIIEGFETYNIGEENNIKSFNPKMKLLRGLTTLIASNQRELSNLSPLTHLTALEVLSVYNTQVSDLTPLINLTALQVLNVSYTQVSDLTPLINLTALQELDVSYTQLSDLTPLINLTALQELNVSVTQVSNLTPLINLTALQELNVSDTQVSDLTPLTNLTALQLLNVSNTQVRDLTPLTNLTALPKLYVSDTQVSDLMPLTNLTALQELGVFNTQVSDLTPLTNLTALQHFYVGNTQVSDLTPLTNLTALKYFSVYDTQVSDLTPLRKMIEEGASVKWSKYEGNINVEDCPLTNPPIVIAKQGNKAILRYWQEQDRVGLKKVNEARLLLVGQGASGKTTLKDKLIDRNAAMPEPDATTKGIVIEPLEGKNTEGSDFTVQVWDFGGQNIQKYAHQFFMSDSVVYAVLSNTREQNANFQYWLNIIELLGKDSPFFIVQNEKDGHKEPLKDITQIQERFPQTFQGVLYVNLKEAATDPRFTILKDSLFVAATQLPHTQKEYLTSFVNVRNQLATLSQTTQAIPFRQFKDLCKAEGVEGELINDYARTLTLLGIALHFEDDLQLKTQVFLRPKWIIDALFALLYAPSVEKQSGRFSALDVENIWTDDAYEGLHSVLLQLMEKFYLCYALSHSRDYIVPQRLPIREKAFVPTPDATHILYKYKFLPSGLLTQLTCRLHTRIEGEKVWNDAVQFHAKDSDGRVFVRENNADNSIEIFGFGHHKADLITQVIEIMDEIHDNSKLEGLKKRLEKLVPCPCTTCATAREKHEEAEFFDYNFLMKLRQKGVEESDRCKLSLEKFPIKTILKHASIRLFKIEEIKALLEKDKIEDALKILRDQFQEDNDVIVQLSRLWSINREYNMGKVMREEYSVEKNKIVDAVLWLLKEWDRTE